MFLYNNPYIKGFEHGGEHWHDILGNKVDPANADHDGVYFKTDANGQVTKQIFQDGNWYNADNPPVEENNPDSNPNTTNNTTTSNTSNTQPTETDDGVYADHDGAYDYKIIDCVW